MKRLLRLVSPSLRAFALLAFAIMAAAPQLADAEGTRTLHPNGAAGNRGVMDASDGTNFASVARGRQFLYVYAQAGEYILLGSRNRSNGGDVFVYNPQSFGTPGAETIPAAADFTCSSQAGGTIGSREQELAGPNSASGAATVTDGFTPCWYIAPSTGIYGVRFTGATGGGQTNTASIDTPPILAGNLVAAWDVTVRSDADSLVDINGRLFTYAWTVYLQSNGRELYNDLYYVSTDGYRYQQTFRGLDPNRAAFYANSAGFLDSNGSPLYRDLRGSNAAVDAGPSITAGIVAQRPQYPIFFSDVAPTGANSTEVERVLSALAIPLVPAPPQLSSPVFVGNVGGNTSTESAGGLFTFTTLNTLTYEIVVSRDGVDFDPANVLNRVLTGTALSGNHSVLWDGRDNNGDPFPAGDYNFQIVGRNGEIHFPMIDVEANFEGGPTLTKLNGTALDTTTVYYDDRGYRAANNTAIGALNGHLCGAGSLVTQPVPTHSLIGVDSADANLGGSGNFYRSWDGSADSNNDCQNAATQYFGTAKGLDLWALEKSPVQEEPIVIVAPTVGVDVGTQVSVTPTVLAGDTAFGSFQFSNAGDVTANGVTYAVTLGNPAVPATCPASVNFTLLPAGVVASYNPAPACTITFTGMPTTLTPGESLSFNFNYVVAPTNPGPIPITTSIAATNEDNDVAPNTANAQTLVARPIITVAKSANPASGSSVDIGDLIQYTVNVSISNAPLTATFTLDDTLSPGLTFGTVISSNPAFNCSGSLTCTLPSGTATGTYSVTYSATVANTAVGSVSNSVEPVGGGGENPPVCTPTCETTHPLNEPNLVIAKTGPATAVVGVAYDYTVTVTNNGSADATANTTVTDTVPAGLTINSAGPGCTFVGQLVTCTIAQADLQMTESVVITINVTPTAAAGASVNNTASVTGGGDPDCVAVGDCDSPPVITTLNAPNLVIDKTGPATAVVGVAYDYTVTVTNNGTADATANATVTDTVPAGLTINSAGPGCTFVGQLVTCTIAQADLQMTESVVITINVTPTAAAGASVSNTASISGGGDPDCVAAGDCDSPSVVTTLNAPNLVIDKTGPATAVVGVAYDYTVSVTNNGTADSTANATVTDTVPAGLTINSAGPGCTFVGQLVTCTIAQADLQMTESVVITINVTPTAAAGASVSNTASISGGGDPDCVAAGDCDSPPVVTLIIEPDVSVSKTANPSDGTSVEPGDTITYTLSVALTGAESTADLVLTDTLDPQLENFQVVNNTDGFVLGGAGNTRTFTLVEGTTIGTYTVSYSVDVVASATGSVGNNVAVDPTDNGGDPDPDCTTCSTTHPLVSDVTLTKSLSAEGELPADGIASPGETLTYAITLANSGGVDETGYAVTDTLDANVAFVGADNGGIHAAGTVTWTGLTVPAGDSLVLTVTVQAADPLPADVEQVVNLAFQAGELPPPCPSAGCVETPVPLVPDLSLVKQATLNDGNGNTLADAGETIDYTLTATNTGNIILADVEIDDPRLPLLSCVPAQPATLDLGEALVCSGSYTVTQADIDAGASIDNTATATAPDPRDPDLPPLEDEDETGTPPAPAAPGIELLKEIASGATYVSPGDNIAYQLTATNTGNVTLGNVSIVDPLLGSLACVPAQPASLAPGATLVCTGSYSVTPADVDNGSVPNTATVTATPPSGGPIQDSDEAVATGPAPGPAIAVVKTRTDTTAPVVAGTVLSYQIVATNTGNVTLSDVTVSDSLIAGLTCVPTVPATLATGASITCTGNYTATQSDVDAGEVVNTATAIGTPPGPVGTPPVTDTDDEITLIPPAPALEVIKVATLNDSNENGTGDEGETIDYAVSASNIGNVTLTGLIVTDSLDGAAPVALTCAPATLAPGQTATCNGYSHTITLAEALAGVTLVNVATSTANDPDGDPVTDDDSTSTPLGDVIADLAIEKTGPANGEIGEEVTFTIVVQNLGPNTAVNTVLTDPTPAGLQFVANTGDCTTAFPCDLGDLVLDETRTVLTTFLIPEGYEGPSTILNIASVTSDTPDPTPGDTSSSASTVVGSGTTLNPPAIVPATGKQTLVLLAMLMMLMASGALRRRY